MFNIKLNPFKLKEYFIEYRKANNRDWYIVPVPEFEYFSNFIASYTDQMLDDLMYRIKKNKTNESDVVVDNVIELDFNEEMTFSFESEEESLYFQLKFCS